MLDNNMSETVSASAVSSQQSALIMCCKLVISSIFSCIILSVFILFWGYVGVQTPCSSHATDYHGEANEFHSNMSEGFAFHIIDSNGYFNRSAMAPGEMDCLILGSSHMESSNVSQQESTVNLLNDYCSPLKFYNIAISGHKLCNCVNNLADACSHFKPNKYVLIEVSNLLLATKILKNVMEGKFVRIPLHTGNKIVYFLQKYFPATRSVFKQAGIWLKISKSNLFVKHNETVNTTPVSEYKTVMTDFLAFARKSVPQELPLVIFYNPDSNIDNTGNWVFDKKLSYYVEAFKTACITNNIVFVDTTEDMVDLYKTKHILAHGFSNTAVGVGHLNKYGHEVIAKRLAEVIKDLERSKN